MLVFNTAILAALVFGLGIVAAVVAVLVVRTQHGYYRVARDRLRRAEAAVGVPAGLRTDTTSTLGGRERVASVNQLVYLLLVASRSPTRLEQY